MILLCDYYDITMSFKALHNTVSGLYDYSEIKLDFNSFNARPV